MRTTRTLTLMMMTATCALPMLLAAPVWSDESRQSAPQDAKHSRQSESKAAGQGKITRPDDCESIKAGTADKRSEAAAEQDCLASQHAGAGTGTSSGTGSGKMGPGSGPR
ncbi:hypothetical protein [Candidatus Nitrospira bockiana]